MTDVPDPVFLCAHGGAACFTSRVRCNTTRKTMDVQLDIFGKAEAMQQADENAAERWKAAADAVIRDLATCRPTLTASDVWEFLDARNEATTHDGRALGTRMKEAAKAGLIAKTQETVPCGRASRHNTEIRVWRSEVYAPAP